MADTVQDMALSYFLSWVDLALKCLLVAFQVQMVPAGNVYQISDKDYIVRDPG